MPMPTIWLLKFRSRENTVWVNALTFRLKESAEQVAAEERELRPDYQFKVEPIVYREN